MSLNQELAKAVIWGKSKGIALEETEKNPGLKYAFCPNIWIIAGTIFFQEDAHPGDLLHEMGHWAITPSCLRPYLSGKLELEEIPEAKAKIDDKYSDYRGFLQAGEQAAIAWSFAAAIAADVDPALPFCTGFENVDVASAIYQDLMLSATNKFCCYSGIASLYHARMLNHKKYFPYLTRWVQL